MNATHTDLLRFIRSVKAKGAAESLPDQQLLETFVNQRSEASFAALVQRHGGMVFSVCRRLLRQPQDTEDAFQAVFLTLTRRAATIRRHESIGSWLHDAAFHIAAKMKRAAARRAVHEGRLSPRSPSDAMDDITWRELRSVLDEELQRLPEKYRAPLVLCYLEARTQDEAARRLGWSKSTFSRRMDDARQLLARRLTRRGLTLPAALTAPLLIDCAAQAALPPILTANTIRASLAAAMGNAASGIVSPQVVALTESGTASLLTKKTSFALVLLASLTLGVGGLLISRAVHSRTSAEAPSAPPPQPIRSASKNQATEIKGRVLDPDGKPFAGAMVYFVPKTARKRADLNVQAMTDKEGAFRLRIAPRDMRSGARLLATAAGYGPDWTDVSKDSETMLRLAKDDVPICGRILDLEGQPIAGVTIAVDLVAKPANGDLTPWLKDQIQMGRDWRRDKVPMKYLDPALRDGPHATNTDVDGQFRIAGFGRERLVILKVTGPTIESYSHVRVVTRFNKAGNWATDSDRIYAASFHFVAAPNKPISGTVRDKITGKPLAGIHVEGWSGRIIGSFNGVGHAVTDETGRYRLNGINKNDQRTIVAGGLSYFNVTKENIADTPGLAPIQMDFELQRGILVRGRLTDKTTGKPLKPGYIEYITPADNPHRKDYPGFGSRSFNPLPSREHADGSFSVLAIPGSGWLCIRAEAEDGYLGFELRDCDERLLLALCAAGSQPNRFHAIVPIELSEKEPKATTFDIALEPGRTRIASIVGPDGKPLRGVRIAGLAPVAPLLVEPVQPLKDASVVIPGLSPRRARTVVFFHPQKKLGKVVQIRGDEKGQLTIRLEPLGALTGRASHGLTVEAEISRNIRDYKDLPWDIALHYALPALKVKQKTDREGRFRLEGLLPGLRYNLGSPLYRGSLMVEPGKTKNLDHLKDKRPDP